MSWIGWILILFIDFRIDFLTNSVNKVFFLFCCRFWCCSCCCCCCCCFCKLCCCRCCCYWCCRCCVVVAVDAVVVVVVVVSVVEAENLVSWFRLTVIGLETVIFLRYLTRRRSVQFVQGKTIEIDRAASQSQAGWPSLGDFFTTLAQFKSRRQYLIVYLALVCQNFDFTLSIFCYWVNFHCF